jgi:hypothetical protein
MFYTLPKEELSWLFVEAQVGQVVEDVTNGDILTGNSVISWTTSSLSWGQKILDILGWKSSVVTTWAVDTWSSVSTGVNLSWSVIGSGDIVSSGSTTSTGWRWQYFTGSKLVETGSKLVENGIETGLKQVETGSLVQTGAVIDSGSVASSWWIDRLSSRWYNLTHPTYTIMETGDKLVETGTKLVENGIETVLKQVETGHKLVETGSTLHSGSTASSWWFEQFVTWIKGTPPVKTGSVDLTGLVNTGQIDQILSGISPDDIQSQATWFADQLADQSSWLEISKFTLPVLRRDKRVE